MTRKTPDHPAPVAATTAARMETGSSTPENPTPALPADARSAGEPHGPGFTPGPWPLDTVDTSIGQCHRIGNFPSHRPGGATYACVYADGVNPRDYGYDKAADELLANARLIAAAPDLYKACRSALAGYRSLCGDDDGPEVFERTLGETMDLLSSALAKAEGREP